MSRVTSRRASGAVFGAVVAVLLLIAGSGNHVGAQPYVEPCSVSISPDPMQTPTVATVTITGEPGPTNVAIDGVPVKAVVLPAVPQQPLVVNLAVPPLLPGIHTVSAAGCSSDFTVVHRGGGGTTGGGTTGGGTTGGTSTGGTTTGGTDGTEVTSPEGDLPRTGSSIATPVSVALIFLTAGAASLAFRRLARS